MLFSNIVPLIMEFTSSVLCVSHLDVKLLCLTDLYTNYYVFG
jgi:hypothetical protein